jgi:hypothetical protein
VTAKKRDPDMIEIHIDTLRHLFDLATDSPLVCSGSFDSDDVDVLRDTATVIGVDPAKITPNEFVTNYPHPFKRRTVTAEPRQVHEWLNGLGNVIPEVDGRVPGNARLNYRPETAAEQRERMAEERADVTCQAGGFGRPCRRLADHPLHHGVPLPKREDDDLP